MFDWSRCLYLSWIIYKLIFQFYCFTLEYTVDIVYNAYTLALSVCLSQKRFKQQKQYEKKKLECLDSSLFSLKKKYLSCKNCKFCSNGLAFYRWGAYACLWLLLRSFLIYCILLKLGSFQYYLSWDFWASPPAYCLYL